MRIFIMLMLLVINIASKDVKTFIPPRATPLLPVVYDEARRLYPEYAIPFYFPALIEHESCVTLNRKKCWNSRSRLKTKREEGAGLGQFTRAYRRSGALRFDVVRELARKYPRELGQLNWSSVYKRPDLQIKGIILKWKETYRRLPTDMTIWDRTAMSDAAYNGGYGGLLRDRKRCGLTKGCNPKIWFGNVEKTCTKSKRILYGNRNACDINRHHVKDVMLTRFDKYYKNWAINFYDTTYPTETK